MRNSIPTDEMPPCSATYDLRYLHACSSAAISISWAQEASVKTIIFRTSRPDAPHLFRFVRRADLNVEVVADAGVVDDFPAEHPKDEADIFMICRHYMASKELGNVA